MKNNLLKTLLIGFGALSANAHADTTYLCGVNFLTVQEGSDCSWVCNGNDPKYCIQKTDLLVVGTRDQNGIRVGKIADGSPDFKAILDWSVSDGFSYFYTGPEDIQSANKFSYHGWQEFRQIACQASTDDLALTFVTIESNSANGPRRTCTLVENTSES